MIVAVRPSQTWARITAATAGSALVTLFIDRTPRVLGSFVPLDVATAKITGLVLAWLGVTAQRELATLIHPAGFGYEIAFHCTGVIPAGMLAAAIFSMPVPIIVRLRGAIVGVLFVLGMNIARLVSLFWIGVRFPAFFNLAHLFLWQCLLAVSVIGFFFWWKRRATIRVTGAGATRSMVATSD